MRKTSAPHPYIPSWYGVCLYLVAFQIRTAVSIRSSGTQCRTWVPTLQRTYSHFHDRRVSNLKMEVAGTSETLQSIYQITQPHISEDRKLLVTFITQRLEFIYLINFQIKTSASIDCRGPEPMCRKETGSVVN